MKARRAVPLAKKAGLGQHQAMGKAETPYTLGSVSAILPTYNSAQFVGRAIDTVVGQRGNFLEEVIVVDDCSTDETVKVIEERSRADPRIRLLRMPRNMGPGEARNRGMAAATGAWVAPIDADDAWTVDRLECFSRVGEPEVDMLFDNLGAYDQGAGAVSGELFPSLPGEMSIAAMARGRRDRPSTTAISSR